MVRRPIGSAFDVAHFHSARSKVQEQGFDPLAFRYLALQAKLGYAARQPRWSRF